MRYPLAAMFANVPTTAPTATRAGPALLAERPRVVTDLGERGGDPAPRFAVLAGAALFLLALRHGVVLTLLLAGAAGFVIALAGWPLPG